MPRIVATTVEMAATMSEFRIARSTSSFWSISPYQRNDGSVQMPTLSLSLNENTMSTRIGA